MEHNHSHAPKIQYANGGNTYKPLIVMVAVVCVLTVLSMVIFQTRDLVDFMRFFMGSFFLVFGFLKILKIKDFSIAYSKYDLIAQRSMIYARLYPFLEIVFAYAYFSNWNPMFTNKVVFVVMVIGALGVLLKLLKKEKIECACLGTVFKLPMTWVTFGEDMLMALMALAMLM